MFEPGPEQACLLVHEHCHAIALLTGRTAAGQSVCGLAPRPLRGRRSRCVAFRPV